MALKIAALVVAFYILYQIKDILVWFVFALIISILINPAIEFLQSRRYSFGRLKGWKICPRKERRVLGRFRTLN